MSPVLFLHTPGLTWSEVISGVDLGVLPTFDGLITQGVLACTKLPQPQTYANEAATLCTGQQAYIHQFVQMTEVRPDGGAIQLSTCYSNKSEPLWEICQRTGIESAAINWPGSHNPYGQGKTPLIISDRFFLGAGYDYESMPVYPDSVSDMNCVGELTDLLHSKEDIADDVFAYFSLPDRKEIRQQFALDMATCISTHNVLTYLLNKNRFQCLNAHYDFISRIGRFNTGMTDYKLMRNAAVRYLDLMLATLLGYINNINGTFCLYSGGTTDSAGVFIMSGNGIQQDMLLENIDAEQVFPTIFKVLGYKTDSQHYSPAIEIFEKQAEKNSKELNQLPKIDASLAHQYTQSESCRSKAIIDYGLQQLALIAESLRADKKFSELVAYLYSIQMQEKHVRFRLMLIEALLLSGSPAQAENEYNQLDDGAREEFQAKILWLWILLQKNQFDPSLIPELSLGDKGAIASLKRLIQLLVMYGEWQQAGALIDRLDTGDTHLLYLKSVCLYQENDYITAMKYINSAIEMEPNINAYRLQKADLCLALQDYKRAHELYKRILSTDPSNAHARHGIRRIAREYMYSAVADKH